MSREQIRTFYAHVWPIFWPVLWWNLIVYHAWRTQLRERGYDGDIGIAVARWGRIVVTYVEPPRPDVPDYRGLTERCAAHIARLSIGLTSTGRLSGDAEPLFGLRSILIGWVARLGFHSMAWAGRQSQRGSVAYPVPILDSS